MKKIKHAYHVFKQSKHHLLLKYLGERLFCLFLCIINLIHVFILFVFSDARALTQCLWVLSELSTPQIASLVLKRI